MQQIDSVATPDSLRVPPGNRKSQHNIRINDIVLERRGVTVDSAMRLVRYFGGDEQIWMNLQTAY